MAPSLPALLPGCSLRAATAQDRWPIRRLVLSAFLDPTQLRWQQFWVIEYEGKVIACGQLREFTDAQELGSLVVARPWRGQQLGLLLTQQLIQQANKPLFLECLGDRRIAFYQRFGFVVVGLEALPRSLQQKFGLSQKLARILRLPLVCMHYQARL